MKKKKRGPHFLEKEVKRLGKNFGGGLAVPRRFPSTGGSRRGGRFIHAN